MRRVWLSVCCLFWLAPVYDICLKFLSLIETQQPSATSESCKCRLMDVLSPEWRLFFVSNWCMKSEVFRINGSQITTHSGREHSRSAGTRRTAISFSKFFRRRTRSLKSSLACVCVLVRATRVLGDEVRGRRNGWRYRVRLLPGTRRPSIIWEADDEWHGARIASLPAVNYRSHLSSAPAPTHGGFVPYIRIVDYSISCRQLKLLPRKYIRIINESRIRRVKLSGCLHECIADLIKREFRRCDATVDKQPKGVLT